MSVLRAFLLNIDYTSSKRAVLRLILKREKDGRVFRLFETCFEPYFYLFPAKKVTESQILSIKSFYRDGEVSPTRVEKEKKKLNGEKVDLLKIYCRHPGHVPVIAKSAEVYGEVYEHQIPFILRYLLDKKIKPTSLVKVEHNGKVVSSIEAIEAAPIPQLRVLACDIETYTVGQINPSKGPCLMISYATDNKSGVLSHSRKFGHKFVEVLSSEKEMLERFCEVVRESHADVIATYNGDEFDLPYLRERAKVLGADFRLGRDKTLPLSKKKGIRNATSLGGRIHFDAYPVVSFLSFIGAVKLDRRTLQAAYEAITGKKKVEIKKLEIFRMWDDAKAEELDELAFYNLDDSLACLDIVRYALPLEIELSRLTNNLLFDTTRLSAMPLVEPFIMQKALERGEVIPRKPVYDEVASADQTPVEGAFVKLPRPGVYENIAVLDFKSLYPSIIISHNIGVDSLNCKCCKVPFVSPQGHKFCKKNKSIIADTLEEILDTRFAIQKKMKKLDKKSEEYKQLYARQWSLKILANSVYGLTLNPRFRWYSREGGEATTALARKYIQDTIKTAEENSFEVLYADTDSAFLLFKKGQEEKVLEFRDEINKALPGRMELELEDFYTRGLFVSKRTEGKGAKKKYALINKNGEIKIRGFELVRRDWSKIARSVQRRVLEILLKEGNVDKAVSLVRKTVSDLQGGKVPLDDLVIITQLRKNPKDYEIMSPEVSAFIKAEKAGLKPSPFVNYVVTSKGKSVSEKAFVREMAKDYDADYYVNHQILPSVLKILSELGVKEDDILTNSKQHTLGRW